MIQLKITIALIAGAALLLASCASQHTNHYSVAIHTENPQTKAATQYAWNAAAILTQKRLAAVRERDPKVIGEIAIRFQTQTPAGIQAVESVLERMDEKFRSGKAKIRFFAEHETPRVLLAQHNDPDSINAYTVLGGSTIYLKDPPNRELTAVEVLVHEMSHLAANTKDHGYLNALDDNTYWSAETNQYNPMPAHKLIENADTYTAFITKPTHYAQHNDHPWGLY